MTPEKGTKRKVIYNAIAGIVCALIAFGSQSVDNWLAALLFGWLSWTFIREVIRYYIT
jgi:hypothetical protein